MFGLSFSVFGFLMVKNSVFVLKFLPLINPFQDLFIDRLYFSVAPKTINFVVFTCLKDREKV